jgi:hypothetical protein
MLLSNKGFTLMTCWSQPRRWVLTEKQISPQKTRSPGTGAPFPDCHGPRDNPVQPYQKNRKLATPDKIPMRVLQRDF